MRMSRNVYFYVLIFAIALVLSSTDRVCATFGDGEPEPGAIVLLYQRGLSALQTG